MFWRKPEPAKCDIASTLKNTKGMTERMNDLSKQADGLNGSIQDKLGMFVDDLDKDVGTAKPK